MTVRRSIATLLAGGLLLAGCGSPSSGSQASLDDRELVAHIAPGDEHVVAQAVNAFGFDLLNELSDGTENTVTSPVSVATLLAMVLAGAGGDTAEAMAKVLHLDDSRDVRVGELLQQLADTDDVTLSVANALWANDSFPFEDDYLAFVRETFAANVDEADLGDPAVAEQIDEWVAEQTRGLIDGIADDLGLPNAAAVLVLVNAVYFLGEWTTAFAPEATYDRPFQLPDGSTVDVPLMHHIGVDLAYAERDGYRMLQLPYGDQERYAMEVLLPDEHATLDSVLQSLDATEWRSAVDALTEQHLSEVALPRFELAWQAQLNDALTTLGMGPAFGDGDFSPMAPGSPALDVVAHKTYLRVDEEGTEAAAVTGGAMITSAPANPLQFVVDRPFVFTISDQQTGTVLFLGTVTDPRG